jgi:hypothetical protein
VISASRSLTLLITERAFFSLAVHFGDAAPLIRHQFDAGNVAQQHRNALVALDDNLLEIGNTLDIATSAHDEFGLGKLDGTTADVDIA